MPVRVAFLTTSRSDYSPAYWVLHEIAAAPALHLDVIAGGAHLSPAHGGTLAEILADGWHVAATVPGVPDGDDGPAYATADGQIVSGFARALATVRPDVALILGDRHEMLAAALAATLVRVPLAHISGGDITAGALDDGIRHALTKLSHLHFPGTADAAGRIRQMGEEPWRIHTVGDPALDHFVRGDRATAQELTEVLGFCPDARTLVVTYHPPTGEPDRQPAELAALVAAVRAHPGPAVLTGPAADPGHQAIRQALQDLCDRAEPTVFVESLGGYRYRGLLCLAGVMVGNSSSGLIEAASVPLPTVNIGNRQAQRERGANVIDVPADPEAVTAAIQRALSAGFRAGLAGQPNPYGSGTAAPAIAAVLKGLPPRERLLAKQFAPWPEAGLHGREAGMLKPPPQS